MIQEASKEDVMLLERDNAILIEYVNYKRCSKKGIRIRGIARSLANASLKNSEIACTHPQSSQRYPPNHEIFADAPGNSAEETAGSRFSGHNRVRNKSSQ
jgi:hypothetical protein